MHVQLGQLVTSRAGRDRGERYLVMGIVDGRSVLLANGEARSVRNPKRKNVRHLWIHDQVADLQGLSLGGRKAIADKNVRQALRVLIGAEGDDLLGDDEASENLSPAEGG